MTTTYNKIHRIKQLGWSWEKVHSQIQAVYPAGLDEKTVYALYRHPHRKPTAHVAGVIDRLHEQLFPDPFPEDINGLMRLYNHLQACRKHPSREQDARDLERFVEGQYQRESELLRRARLVWLLGNIAFDRIPGLRESSRRQQLVDTREQASGRYRQAVEHMEQYNQQHQEAPLGAIHLYKARQNILACYLNAVPQEFRYRDPDLLTYVRESDYLPNSRATLEAEPFQWSIARNSLRFCSLLQRRDEARYFFQALVTAARQFMDLDYRPLNTMAISASPDFAWALEQALTTDFMDQLQQELN